MIITLNNREETFPDTQLTIDDLLNIKNFTFKLLVIKVNGMLVKKDMYNSTFIHNGDNVAVIHLVSGG